MKVRELVIMLAWSSIPFLLRKFGNFFQAYMKLNEKQIYKASGPENMKIDQKDQWQFKTHIQVRES